ncbi:MAG TPA: helix-hairpin-helix domain-containing protein [Bacteroidia bacterium]|jgi:DNA uptake protein ComE-like DNA-binding protein
MKRFLRDYFSFNKRERNGIFILLSIIAVLVFYLNISTHLVDTTPVDFSQFKKEIAEFNALLESADSADEQGQPLTGTKHAQTEGKAERFDFDPNNLPEEDWKRLGLSEKQIRSIRNYESKGGKFRRKEDVKKMYCIREEQYNSLEPFIHIREQKEASSVFIADKLTVATVKPEAVVVELNTADSALLGTLKGIGPFFAKTIIKYRNALGGFVSKEQLLEVWKFDQEKFNAIEASVRVDVSKVKRININTCEAADLKIPYIKWNVANTIVNYRKNHGKFKTIEEIQQTDLVDEETYRKIAPYLVVD